MSFSRTTFALLAAMLLVGCSASITWADELAWLSGQPVASNEVPARSFPRASLQKVGGALAVVLGGFFLLTIVMRKQSPRLPVNEMMEPLGSVQIAPKVRLHLVRFGTRIIVLHISGQNVQRVAELEDPDEVQQLLSTLHSNEKTSVPVSVSALLKTVEHGSPHAMRGLEQCIHWLALTLTAVSFLFCGGAQAAGQGGREDLESLQLAISQQPLPQSPSHHKFVSTEQGNSAPKPTSRRTAVESMLASLDEVGMEAVSKRTQGQEAVESDDDASLMPSWESWTSPERIVGSIRVIAIMAALSLAPALLLMTTCYVRLVVVLGLLRQALGSQQLPPQQVTTTLAMFLTALIMWPVWSQVHRDAIEPYSNPEIGMSAEDAWTNGVRPIRKFMIEQIRRAGNGPDVAMFLDYLQISDVKTNAEIPLQALLPAFFD